MDEQTVTRRLDTFKDLLYQDEEQVLTSEQFAPLLELVRQLAESRFLVRFLPKVLPLSLKLLDHHEAGLKIVGASCLDHIVDAVDTHHLSKSGTDLLLLDTLLKSLNYNDTDFMKVVMPLILKSARKFRLSPAKLDDLFLQVHQSIGMTCEIEKKSILWSSVPTLIDLLGTSSVKFVSHYIIPIITDQLSFPLDVVRDGKSTSDVTVISLFAGTLATITALVKRVPNERMHPHINSLLLSLAKFVFTNGTFFSRPEAGDETEDEVKLKNVTREAVQAVRSLDCERVERLIQIIVKEVSRGPEEARVKGKPREDLEERLLCKKEAVKAIFCSF